MLFYISDSKCKVHLLIDVIGELIVAAKSDQSAQAEAVGEEYLGDGIDPHFGLHQLAHVRHHVKLDALESAGKGDS